MTNINLLADALILNKICGDIVEFFVKLEGLYWPFFILFSLSALLLALMWIPSMARRRDQSLFSGGSQQLLAWFFLTFVVWFFLYSGSVVLDIKPHWQRGAILYHFLESGNISNEIEAEAGPVDGGSDNPVAVAKTEQPWGVVAYTTLVAVVGMFLLCGVLVSTIVNIMSKRTDAIAEGRVFYKQYNAHTVFIGYNPIIVGLLRQLEEKAAATPKKGWLGRIKDWITCNNIRYIILTSQNIETVQQDLFSHLEVNLEEKVLFLYGGYDINEDIRKVRPDQATRIFILGDESVETDCDSRNITAVQNVTQIVEAAHGNHRSCFKRIKYVRFRPCGFFFPLFRAPYYVLISPNQRKLATDILSQLDKTAARQFCLVQIPDFTSNNASETRESCCCLIQKLKQKGAKHIFDLTNQVRDILLAKDLAPCLDDSFKLFVLLHLSTHQAGEDAKASDRQNADLLCAFIRFAVRPVECHILIQHQASLALLKKMGSETVFSSQISQYPCPYMDYIPFNFQECWSQKALTAPMPYSARKKGPHDIAIPYKPLDYEPLQNSEGTSDRFVHLVVLGMTPMGVALALKALHIAHYGGNQKNKNLITFIDSNIEVQESIFLTAYPALCKGIDIIQSNGKKREGSCTEFTDVQLQFIGAKIESSEMRDQLEEWAKDKNRILTIAVCFNDQASSLAAAMYLPEEIFKFRHGEYDDNGAPVGDDSFVRVIPVLVHQKALGNILWRMENYNSIDQLIRKNDKSQNNTDSSKTIDQTSWRLPAYNNLYPFGMLDGCYDLDLNSITMAKQTNYIYNFKNSYWEVNDKTTERANEQSDLAIQSLETESFDSLEPEMNWQWYTLGLQNKWSNRYFVDHISTKCNILGIDLNSGVIPERFSQEQIDILAPVEHDRWTLEKLMAGLNPPAPERLKKMQDLKKELITMQGLKEEEIKERKELENTIKCKKAEKKGLKNIYEKELYEHDCLIRYNELLDGDKEYDLALCAAIPKMLRDNQKNTQKSQEGK